MYLKKYVLANLDRFIFVTAQRGAN